MSAVAALEAIRALTPRVGARLRALRPRVAATNKQRSILAMTGHVTLSRAGEVRAAARFVLLRACTDVIGMFTLHP
jgi:hypothetical protein